MKDDGSYKLLLFSGKVCCVCGGCALVIALISAMYEPRPGTSSKSADVVGISLILASWLFLAITSLLAVVGGILGWVLTPKPAVVPLWLFLIGFVLTVIAVVVNPYSQKFL